MKMIADLPVTSNGPVAGKVHVLWRYLERLAGAWEYASDKDLAILETMLDELERELARAGEEALPPDADAFVAAARRRVDRARSARADLRMRHLEAAGDAMHALLAHFETRG